METLERLIEYKWNFLGIQVFMRAFMKILIELIVFLVQKLLYYQITANIT